MAKRTVFQTSLAKLPLAFERNQGQTDAQVKFLTRGADYSLFLTADEAVFVLRSKAAEPPATLRLKLGEGIPTPEIEALDRQSGYVNYFIGNDPERWQTKVQRFAKVRYKLVYPGIDLVYHGSQQRLEYDFVVAPGADPKSIQLRFSGEAADVSLSLTDDGDLLVESLGNTLRQKKPVAYQEIEGRRRAVDARYVLGARDNGPHAVTLALGDYDGSQPLVIDPVLAYSTFAGRHRARFRLRHRGRAGWPCLRHGQTGSTDYPTSATAYQPMKGPDSPPFGTFDAFVTKLAPDGSLVYSTYLGGSTTDWGAGIAVNNLGEAFVVGRTELAPNQTVSDFPIFPSPTQVAQGTPGGGADTFVARLSADGSALVYSTYLGGKRDDEPMAIAIDPAGNAYVLGLSFNEFPITVGPIGPGPIFFRGGLFVTKVSPDGAGFVYSAVVNANNSSVGWAIAVDATGHAYVAGSTAATNFPTTTGQPCGGGDAVVFKLTPDGAGFEYITCLGGERQC